MNSQELRVEMLRHNDTGEALAKYLEISPVSFSNKLNGKGTEFTQGEIKAIKTKYSLSDERTVEIFFAY